MKYLIHILLFMVMLISFVSCSNKNTKNINNENKKTSIVTTIFPEYDWVKKILGDKISEYDLVMLYNTGTDLHSYQPTADDIIKISNSDIFIYVGGESDEWIEEVLNNANNKNIRVIKLLDILGSLAKEEEHVEGMQKEEHHNDEHNENEEKETEYDEHVWLSLKNAKIFVEKITEIICQEDNDNVDIYKNNASNYINKLTNLDLQYKNTVDSALKKTVLFGDRFPFRYLVDDYGLKYYAAFAGCSAESEAAFETIIFLANKIDELKLNAVLTIEGTNHKIAQTIIENTKTKNQKILVMNSMQSTTAQDVEKEISYISIMEKNLDVLRQALN